MARMIFATSIFNRILEVINTNMDIAPFTPKPAQEVKNLSLTSQARDAANGFSKPKCGLLSVGSTLTAGCDPLIISKQNHSGDSLTSTPHLGKRLVRPFGLTPLVHVYVNNITNKICFNSCNLLSEKSND